jgi:hypothetical protein
MKKILFIIILSGFFGNSFSQNPTYTAFDKDAKTFLANAATLSGVTYTAQERFLINRLTKELRHSGGYSNLKAVYPMLGSDSITQSLNLKSPYNADTSFRLVGLSRYKELKGYVIPDGSHYVDTKINYNTTLSTLFMGGYFLYDIRDNQNLTIGVYQNTVICPLYLPAGVPEVFGGGSAFSSSSPASINYNEGDSSWTSTTGFWGINRIDQTANSQILVGEKLVKNVIPYSSRPNFNVKLGGVVHADGTAWYYSLRPIGLFVIGNSTDTTSPKNISRAITKFGKAYAGTPTNPFSYLHKCNTTWANNSCSSMIKCADDSFLIVWNRFAAETGGGFTLWGKKSIDKIHWTKQFQITALPSGTQGYLTPTMYVKSNGNILLISDLYNATVSKSAIMKMYSYNNGRTFTDTANIYHGTWLNYLNLSYNKLFKSNTGRLILTISQSTNGALVSCADVYVNKIIYSDDEGTTWTTSASTVQKTGQSIMEGGISKMPSSDSLLFYLRGCSGVADASTSGDNGATWTVQAVYTKLPMSNSDITIQYMNGQYIATTNGNKMTFTSGMANRQSIYIWTTKEWYGTWHLKDSIQTIPGVAFEGVDMYDCTDSIMLIFSQFGYSGNDADLVYKYIKKTTLAGTTKLTTPSITVARNSDVRNDITWSQDADASSYQLEDSIAGGGTWTQIGGTIDFKTTSYAHTGLTANTTYFYRMKKIGDNINFTTSNYSTEGSALTYPAWPYLMYASYASINSHHTFTQAEKDTIITVMNTASLVSTYGPSGQNKTVADFFFYLHNNNTTAALTARTQTKSGATMDYWFGRIKPYDKWHQNNTPADTAKFGWVFIFSTDGFIGWTSINWSSNNWSGYMPSLQNLTALTYLDLGCSTPGNYFNDNFPSLSANTLLAHLYFESALANQNQFTSFGNLTANIHLIDVWGYNAIAGSSNTVPDIQSSTCTDREFATNGMTSNNMTSFARGMTILNLRTNALPQAVIDALLSSLYTYYNTGGNDPTANLILYIDLGTNAAPSAAGLTTITNIQAIFTAHSHTFTCNHN